MAKRTQKIPYFTKKAISLIENLLHVSLKMLLDLLSHRPY